jgi:hypothetical protein
VNFSLIHSLSIVEFPWLCDGYFDLDWVIVMDTGFLPTTFVYELTMWDFNLVSLTLISTVRPIPQENRDRDTVCLELGVYIDCSQDSFLARCKLIKRLDSMDQWISVKNKLFERTWVWINILDFTFLWRRSYFTYLSDKFPNYQYHIFS